MSMEDETIFECEGCGRKFLIPSVTTETGYLCEVCFNEQTSSPVDAITSKKQ